MDVTKDEKFRREQLRFGAQVRLLRLKAGLSQEQLADACSIDRTYIGGIERGERNPSLKNILRIACALGVTPVALFDSTSLMGA